jgi:hypothetical protein
MEKVVMDGIATFMKTALLWSVFMLFYWSMYFPESFGYASGKMYVKYHQGFTVGITKKD